MKRRFKVTVDNRDLGARYSKLESAKACCDAMNALPRRPDQREGARVLERLELGPLAGYVREAWRQVYPLDPGPVQSGRIALPGRKV